MCLSSEVWLQIVSLASQGDALGRHIFERTSLVGGVSGRTHGRLVSENRSGGVVILLGKITWKAASSKAELSSAPSAWIYFSEDNESGA